MNEAHLLIDANRSRVGLKRSQERHSALGLNIARDSGDKSLGIPATTKVRVRADRDHLCENGGRQSLARHCSEASTTANPHEPAKLGSAFAKRASFCQGGESHHLGKIRGLQRENSLGKGRSIRNRRAHHLNERSTANKLPARRNLGQIFKKENRDIALGHNLCEVRVCL